MYTGLHVVCLSCIPDWDNIMYNVATYIIHVNIIIMRNTHARANTRTYTQVSFIFLHCLIRAPIYVSICQKVFINLTNDALDTYASYLCANELWAAFTDPLVAATHRIAANFIASNSQTIFTSNRGNTHTAEKSFYVPERRYHNRSDWALNIMHTPLYEVSLIKWCLFRDHSCC